MNDATVEEIWISSPERVFIARNGRSELTNLLPTQEEVRTASLVRSLYVERKKVAFHSHPFGQMRVYLMEAALGMLQSWNLTAAHWAVNIRKHLL